MSADRGLQGSSDVELRRACEYLEGSRESAALIKRGRSRRRDHDWNAGQPAAQANLTELLQLRREWKSDFIHDRTRVAIADGPFEIVYSRPAGNRLITGFFEDRFHEVSD